MDEPTLDADVVITARGAHPPRVVYRRLSTGAEWTVTGTCNQCGLCVVGAANGGDYAWDGPVGTPYAVRDLRYGTRPDEPVTPGFDVDMAAVAAMTPGATVAGCALVITGTDPR